MTWKFPGHAGEVLHVVRPIDLNMSKETGISLRAAGPNNPPAWFELATPLFDRLLGIHRLNRLYQQHRLRALPPFDFIERTLSALALTVAHAPADLANRIPARGPLIVVCNHPFGGVEALALAHSLRSIRTDIKILANAGLKVFAELAPLFIATNPLKTSQKNLVSIRACSAHLGSGGVLVIFPAGKVSFSPRGEDRIRDAAWNRLVGHLALRHEAAILPVFFAGANSRLFQTLGKIWDRSKLLMLPREFLRMRGRRIEFHVGHAIAPEVWRGMDAATLTCYARLMTYLLEPSPAPELSATPPASAGQALPLAPLGQRERIVGEIAALPAEQRLLDFKHFSVFHASAAQIPLLQVDIARERERVFRLYDEGSGQPRDGDAYDHSYVQLFVWDNAAQSLVGAYRLGQADRLRQENGPRGMYLAQMFEFDAAFYDEMPPALELGRSFVVPEHQKSFHALYLLWQGIGRYLVAHPRYRRLYGTVSLSRQYDEAVIALICDALIEPSPHVRPRHPLQHVPHPEWLDYRAEKGRFDLQTLSACVRGLDAEGKDTPVLLKHYHKLGARFHCVGVDPNFNATPGLLLSVDMDALPDKQLATFLGEGAATYAAFKISRTAARSCAI